jgi:beta-alanine--pyruvate transaminase
MTDLQSFWMPFTANRQFKAQPRMLVSASGMHYRTDDGREILDGAAGLWCCNAGHGLPSIVNAVRDQIAELDYAPSFQMGHPKSFAVASRLAALAGGDLNRVFFANSGSEAVESALKIALAYHQARGDGRRTRLIGRERGYHGVNFGGISVGGLPNNRRAFGPLLNGVDHIRHTHDLARNAFSHGQPEHGAELADDLERIVQLHDKSTIAAVIVEPVAGSTGVLVPPVGYLQRLREICDRHGILLIFDEVITGFGRVGAPFGFQRLGVRPDMVTLAKGLTNGVIPMGAVLAKQSIHDAFMTGPEAAIELFHGYTYSGNPAACAAALATLDAYEDGGLLTRAIDLDAVWAEGLHSLRDAPNVIDIRNFGLMGAIELAPRPDQPGSRAFEAFVKAYEAGLLIRVTGDTIALSPPLIVSEGQIAQLVSILKRVLMGLN